MGVESDSNADDANPDFASSNNINDTIIEADAAKRADEFESPGSSGRKGATGRRDVI